MRPIVTEHVFPPIPIRKFDWSAYREGWDLGELVGYGETEEEAINDLLEKESETLHKCTCWLEVKGGCYCQELKYNGKEYGQRDGEKAEGGRSRGLDSAG